MVAYLDSSVVMRYVLEGDIALRHAEEYPRVVSSELLEIECRRVLFRARWESLLDDASLVEATMRLDRALDYMDLIELDAPVKKRAMEAFPIHVKTLDALHLASAIRLAEGVPLESISLFSYDRQMNLCAQALGFRVALG